jgi:hypothetical protein
VIRVFDSIRHCLGDTQFHVVSPGLIQAEIKAYASYGHREEGNVTEIAVYDKLEMVDGELRSSPVNKHRILIGKLGEEIVSRCRCKCLRSIEWISARSLTGPVSGDLKG